MNYRDAALSDAKDTVEYFADEIVDQLMDGKASDDLLNDYSRGDEYHHESHVDQAYGLLEAAQLLDELYKHEETDSGLWDGQEPREAIATQAAFTYGNAVYAEWTDLIKQINDDADDIAETFNEEGDTLRDKIAELDDGPEETADAREAAVDELQDDLDALDERKREALREMVADSSRS